ncbi:MAG TPA: phosphatidate cytidylyltransferase [Deinococcales bacterium]|nr:phosphatidate cytidylyltransferase [Deinococcales bacterium]
MAARAAERRFPFRRVLSGLAAVLTTAVVLWAGLPLLGPAWLILTCIAIAEYSGMLAKRGIPIRKRSLWAVTPLTLLAALPADMLSGLGLPAVIGTGTSWRELLLILVATYLVVLELVRPNQNSLNCVVFSLFGYVYIPWLFSFMITLRYVPDATTGIWYLALPLIGVVASDVGAYTIGSLFGRNKLAPEISPSKTVEGALGGMLFALVFVSGLHWVASTLFDFSVNTVKLLFFALTVGAASQAGDLFESMLKRWTGVKDSGRFLPGQGGVLDRIDSHLFAVAFSYLFINLFAL